MSEKAKKITLRNKSTGTVKTVSLSEIDEQLHVAKCTIDFGETIDYHGEEIVSISQKVDSMLSLKKFVSEFGINAFLSKLYWVFDR